MPESDTTLTPAAVAPATQPAEQAVPPSAPPSGPESSAPPSEPSQAQPAAPERLWAGKYKTPEDMERGLADSTSEAFRLYQDNKRLQDDLLTAKGQAAQATVPVAPQYTPDQLDSMKLTLLTQQAEAIAAGDTAKAKEYAGNIVWCDREARKAEMTAIQSQAMAQTAYASLKQEVTPILERYKEDLIPGRPLYDKAMELYQRAIQAGAPANELTATSAVLLAANGVRVTAGETMKAQSAAVQNMNQAIKAAAASGSGGALTNAAPPTDFSKMTPGEFEKWRTEQGLSVRRR